MQPLPSVSSLPTRDWLQLSIPGVDDSFTNDLLRLFDKRHAKLRAEMLGIEEQGSSSQQSSTHTSLVVLNDPAEDNPRGITPTEPIKAMLSADVKNERRRSAVDLLRRSSTYLRSKFSAVKLPSERPDMTHTDREHRPLPDELDSSVRKKQRRSLSLLVSRSISAKKRRQTHIHDMVSSSTSLPPPSNTTANTTISIPRLVNPADLLNDTYHSVLHSGTQTPIITQYPPKPLKYSPVETVDVGPSTIRGVKARKIKRRISQPAFHLPSISQRHTGLQRRRSDSDIQNSRGNSQHSTRSATGRQQWRWSQWITCNQLKKYKGNKLESSK